MSNWNNLKTAISSIIKTNGNQEITGQILQDMLKNIVSSLGTNATYAGIATPTTNPGIPDGPVFYLACKSGNYTNFSNIKIDSEVVVLLWNNSIWTKEDTGIPSSDKLTKMLEDASSELDSKINNAILEISALGVGAIILTWNTDLATTRKTVASNNRKTNLIVSYTDEAGKNITEKYIGTDFTDSAWTNNNNWINVGISDTATTENPGLMSAGDKKKLDSSILLGNAAIPGFIGGFSNNKVFINKIGNIENITSIAEAAKFGYAYLYVRHLRGKSVSVNVSSSVQNGAHCWYDDNFKFISYFQNSSSEIPYDVVVPDNATILGVSAFIKNDDFSVITENKLLLGNAAIPGFIGGFSNNKVFINKIGNIENITSIAEAAKFGYAYLYVRHLRGKSVSVNVSSSVQNGAHCWYDDNFKFISYFQNSSSEIPYDVVVPDNATILGVSAFIKNDDFSVITENKLLLGNAYKINTDFINSATTENPGLMSADDKKKLDSIESSSLDTNNHWKGKKWIAYGTSITNTSNEGKYAKYLEKISGMIRTNRGFSGGGITTSSNQNIYNAIMNADSDGKLDADLITLECYANDASAPLGTVTDITGNSTFAAALNTCIRYLQSKTSAQIAVLQSPPGRYQYNDTSIKYDGTETYGSDNHTRNDVTELMRKICELNNVYFINWSGLGLYRIKDNDLYVVDQIHHTELGGYVFAQGLWAYLKNIPLFETSIPDEYK